MNSAPRIAIKKLVALASLSAAVCSASVVRAEVQTQVPKDLTDAVAALPASTQAQKLKKAALTWALEDAAGCYAIGGVQKKWADDLVTDVRSALTRDIGAIAPGKPPETLFPPIPDVENNPIAKFALSRAGQLARSNTTWPKGEAGSAIRDEKGGWRFMTASEDAEQLAFALGHPQSRLRGDASLVAPMFRRMATVYEYMQPGWKGNGDFGVADNAAEMYLLVRTVYPDLILPSLQKRWEKAIEVNIEAVLATEQVAKSLAVRFREGKPGTAYPNADLRQINALYLASLVLNRPDLKALAEAGLKLQATGLYPDGGYTYIYKQNEVLTYHGINLVALGRHWQLTGSDLAKRMITGTQWYYPLSVEPTGLVEYYTAAQWKPYWNMVTGNDGATIVAYFTGDGHNARVARLGEVRGGLWLASFYRSDLKPLPAPDNYLTYDQNILGPRGRFGDYSFAGTSRQSSNAREGNGFDDWTGNRGKGTYVGCMIANTEEERKKNPNQWALSAAFQDANVEIRIADGEPDLWRLNTHAFIAQDDTNQTVVNDKFSSLTTTYKIVDRRGRIQPFEGHQMWLMTPQRMLGLVELQATADVTTKGVSGLLKFISGRGSWGTRKEFKSVSNNQLAYGRLLTTLHDQDFGPLTTGYTDTFNGNEKKSGLIVLGDTATTTRRFKSGERRFYLVEVRPDGSAAAKAVRRIEGLPAGVVGIELTEADQKAGDGLPASSGQTLRLYFNRGDVRARLNLDPANLSSPTLHFPGETHRADWLPPMSGSTSGSRSSEVLQDSRLIELLPGEQVVVRGR